jgi:NAD+ kinase
VNSKFKSIGIIAKSNDNLVIESVRVLHQFLQEKGIEASLDSDAQKCVQDDRITSVAVPDMHKKIDLAIVIGGDGTLLSAGHSMIEHDIPIVGINRGRLGFLTEISPENMLDDIEQVLLGNYFQQNRSALVATLIRGDQKLKRCIALNDVVVHSHDVVRMIELETSINGDHLNSLRADGLIVATPTGSTAYALSGGGPIVHPKVPATLLVPICPHTLSNRPIVIDDKSIIEITYSSHNELPGRASIDGQLNTEIIAGDKILVEPCPNLLKLLQPKNYSYFKVLRTKLNWSIQP